MSRQLPDSIDIKQLAQSGGSIRGFWPKEQLDGMPDTVRAVMSNVVIDLQATVDHSDRIVIDGTIEAQIELECQRCLGAYAWQLDDVVKLAVVADQQAWSGLEAYEALLLDENGAVDTAEFIEAEVIVRLPEYPKHPKIEQCDQKVLNRTKEFDASELAENPFAKLRQTISE